MRFVVQYTPKRPNLLATMTPSEAEAIGAHFQYLKAHFDAKKLDFAGRREDAAFGIAVFQADSAEQAQAFTANDPAVRAGVFTATYGEFSYALTTLAEGSPRSVDP